jgi:hypothetical protein
MNKFLVLRVGRADSADIQLADSSVSRLHAELVITANGRYYLTDCNSSGGISVQKNGQWSRIKQAYVAKNEVLLLGQYQTSVEELVVQVKEGRGAGMLSGVGGAVAEPSPQDNLPEGPVRRDLSTGEILRQED